VAGPKTSVRTHAQLAGEGALIAMIHGIGASTSSWAGLVPLLRDRFACLSYDLRGHGLSEVVPGRYELDAYVDDLAALFDTRGIAGAHLAGHSLGGVIAQAFALRYPERTKSAILVSTAACRTPEEREAILALARTVEREGAAFIMERAMERWFTPGFQAAHPEVIARRKARVLETDPASFANAFRIYAESDLGDELRRIAAPTLILTGEHDIGSNPRIARAMAERIPGAEVEILPELRHAVLLEAPALVAERIAAFVTRLESGR
jgi:pimeloyl-ACP methyl ester carboxylesterase